MLNFADEIVDGIYFRRVRVPSRLQNDLQRCRQKTHKSYVS
jgi:hypothetical protein